MATEAQQGEFTLVYNTETSEHPVGLSNEQHSALQLFIAALSKQEAVTVVKSVYIDYVLNPKHK